MKDVDQMRAISGRQFKEDSTTVNIADLTENIETLLTTQGVNIADIETLLTTISVNLSDIKLMLLTQNSKAIMQGTATGGSSTTIEDTSKDFESAIFASKLAAVNFDGTTYFRSISASSGSTLTISAICAGVAASCIYGESSGGQITVVNDVVGVAGNTMTMVIQAAPGSDDNPSASLNDDILTVYLGKTADALDDAKNTGTAIAAVIDTVPGLSCTMTGSGGVVAVTVTPEAFIGGIDAIAVPAGASYQVI